MYKIKSIKKFIHSPIDFTYRNNNCLVSLQSPQKLNSIDLPTITAFSREIRKWRDSRQFPSLILLHSPLKPFCAGGDIKTLYNNYTVDRVGSYRQNRVFFKKEYELYHELSLLKKRGVVMCAF